jgi:hypothetical protein
MLCSEKCKTKKLFSSTAARRQQNKVSSYHYFYFWLFTSIKIYRTHRMSTFVVSSSGKTIPGKEISFHFRLPTPSQESAAPVEISIPLYVDMGVGIGGDTWPAAELFCDFLTSPGYYSEFCDMFRGKSVIELGSGNGLVGILVDKVFEVERVSVTDMESHVPLIAHNLQLNRCDIISSSGHCSADAIDWMAYSKDRVADDCEDKFDIILALEW